jgi:hypothetical protein
MTAELRAAARKKPVSGGFGCQFDNGLAHDFRFASNSLLSKFCFDSPHA